jgi:hypothetical protein
MTQNIQVEEKLPQIETTKTYIIDEGNNVSFHSYKNGQRSDCELTNPMVFVKDDLIDIVECDCCDTLLYRFYHSKKKLLQVERNNLTVLCNETEVGVH